MMEMSYRTLVFFRIYLISSNMESYTLTLVQTTQNRREEVKRFVKSLNNQDNVDFSKIQYIFVDQGNHKDVFSDLNSELKFEYIQCERCSLSHARNIALERVRGVYVAFPDDDCWYEPDTLTKVFDILLKKDYDGVSGIGYNENGVLTTNFPPKASEITKVNRCSAISYTLFLRFDSQILFDEIMGVGSPYGIGSGEESDYLLTLIEKNNYKVLYDPLVIVHHPAEVDVAKDEKALAKAYNYARGDGYLYKKHKMPFTTVALSLIRPAFGICFFVCCFKMYEAKRSFYRLKGRVEGLKFKM